MHTLTTPTDTRSTRAHRSSRCTGSRSRRAWRGQLVSPHVVAHSASYTLDALQRKTQETITIGGNSHTLATTWTPTGQKASQTSPGGLTAEYRYDANQQLAGVSLPAGQLSIAERQWNAPKKISYPGGSLQTRDYDALLRPTRIKLNDSGQATKLDYAYTYDAESNITQKATEHGSYDYAYDDLYRLTAANNPSGLPNEAWTYDKLGNRLTDNRRAGDWQYNGNNQLLKSFTTNGDPVTHAYDENGSLTRKQSPGIEPTDNQQYLYDAANRLVEVKDRDGNRIASYQYDPFGRRIAKTTSLNTTFFIYGDEGLIAEATPTGSIATEYGWQPQNIWGTDPLYIKTTKTNGQSPEIFYYQNDHLGTPQKAVDSQGNVVWEAKALAFGETTVAQGSSIANPLRFPGQYEDPETRMRDNWFRTYSQAHGAYAQFDPIGLEGGLNGYLYADSNPLAYVDPTGENVVVDFLTDQRVVDFSAGLGDALLFGTGSYFRQKLGISSVDECSESYKYGGIASFGFGAGRLAYAGLAKAGSLLAASGAQASAFRASLKTVFRGGVGRNWRPPNLAGKTDDQLRASAGKTNSGVNAYGAGVTAGGATGALQCGCPK